MGLDWPPTCTCTFIHFRIGSS